MRHADRGAAVGDEGSLAGSPEDDRPDRIVGVETVDGDIGNNYYVATKG